MSTPDTTIGGRNLKNVRLISKLRVKKAFGCPSFETALGRNTGTKIHCRTTSNGWRDVLRRLNVAGWSSRGDSRIIGARRDRRRRQIRVRR